MKEEIENPTPLRGLEGVAPPAPEWFGQMLAKPVEEATVDVDGAAIEYRFWGDRGKPGLVFLHGNAAHMGWWDFIAPFFARTHRVAVYSLSGMGHSDWRERYSIDAFAAEALAVAEAAGAQDAGKTVFVGHSLGGLPVLRILAEFPDRARAGILVDAGLPGPEMVAIPPTPGQRIYPTVAAALDRFRLSPAQPCENLYIADHLARRGLRTVEGGYTWSFDRALWGGIEMGDPWADLARAGVPLAIVRGECSPLTGGGMGKRIRSIAPRGTPHIDIPEAYHHVMIDQPLALVATLRTLLQAWA